MTHAAALLCNVHSAGIHRSRSFHWRHAAWSAAGGRRGGDGMLAGYELLQWLGPTAGSKLYRARRLASEPPVLLKVMDGGVSSLEDLDRFRREYTLFNTLKVAAVPRPLMLFTGGAAAAMVLENCGGMRLESALATPLPLRSALALAAQLAHALAGLHGAQVIHQDLRPANLLLDDNAARIWMVDLSRASARAGVGAAAPETTWGGDLAYISPEQTGRMHTQVDHRTDLYSLGVVLYRMLSGMLPFQASDPLEWVHAHLARTPRPLVELAPGLPRMVSDVVDRLLAKAPDERYRSAHGAAVDLEQCLQALTDGGRIEPFTLGAQDVADRFHIPHNLYGREREVNALVDAYRRVAAQGTTEVVLISVYSGIGKSTLVNALQPPVAESGGIFISGKFDQHKSDIPYAGIAQAFRALVRQILAGGEEQVEEWRQRLLEALRNNAQVLMGILPELETVIGRQPPAPAVGVMEAQNRFHATFRRFLGVCPRAEQPVALFLDDLHWADVSSLTLLEELLTHAGMHHLLVVGAYRDNEVGPTHPLRRMLERLRSAGTPTVDMPLAPLLPEHLAQLMADTFQCTPETAEPLARLVHAKTGGDPFFAIQFLTMLQQDHLVVFDAVANAWRWDVQRIADQDYTDNVVAMMLEKLQRLPEDTRAIMTLAAFLGSKADVQTLVRSSGLTQDAVHTTLRAAVREGLMLQAPGAYRFIHDRIRQAAYSLTPENQRADRHLALARVLLKSTPAPERAEDLFEIANHFMAGASRIQDPAEKMDVAQLLLVSGRHAKASAAHKAAAGFLATGVELLGPQSWEKYYQITYALHLEQADCAWLVGEFEKAEALLAILLHHAQTNLEKLAAYEIQVRLHTLRGQLAQSIDAGVRALGLVGLDFAAHPSADQVKQAQEDAARLLEARSVESLLELPPVTSPEMNAALDVACVLLDAAAFTDANLGLLLTLFMVETSMRHGNNRSSAVGYAAFAMSLLDLDRPADAYRFGKLACDLVERQGGNINKAKVAVYVEGTLNPWIKPYRSGLAYLSSAARAGAENGDFLWAAYCQGELIWLLLMAGEPLAELGREVEERLATVRTMKGGELADSFVSVQRCIRNLRGLTDTFSTYDGEGFSEAEYEATLERSRAPVVQCSHYLWKMEARFVLGLLDDALAASVKAKANLWGLYRLCTLAEFHFYDALIRAARYADLPQPQQAEERVLLASHEQALQVWAQGCRENHAAKHALVAAEIARIDGRDMDAGRLYERAVSLARDGGLIQNEAIANETAARFYQSKGLRSIATMYLREARVCYARWGADGKVRLLEEQNPHLFAPLGGVGGNGAVTALGMRAAHLDLLTVIKASQAISREIVLGDLLETLMHVVLESAGAQTASLLLTRGSRLALATIASVEEQRVRVQQRADDVPTAAELPLSILNFVRRSGEQVILANATLPNPFAADPYLVQHRPKSILCLPIVRQAELIGVLYLENRLVADAFTPDRLAVLELLAGQAAISLDHTRLYADLRHENAERRQAETALRESRQLLQDVIDNSSASIYVKDLEGHFLLVNRHLAEDFARDRTALLGLTDFDLFPPEQADAIRAFDQRVLAAGAALEGEETIRLQDGTHTYLSIKTPLTGPNGRPYAICGISTDVTERKRAEAALRKSEEQLRQAQKMEAIGNLAGGIAHDFNNLLSVILGYSGMLQSELAPGDPCLTDLLEIEAAGIRATELTRQLLAFGRKQILQPKLVNLNEILMGIERMLGRLIGEDIELSVSPAPGLGKTKVDPGQIEQIVMNLAVNSRDAMPQGGKLTLETANMELDADYAAEHPDVNAGPHVMLAVTDSGVGMSKETQAHMFEPFFTTKPKGKGTGLGLATVFGIVKQSGGTIAVDSQPGRGTTFSIYFPRSDAGAADTAVTVIPKPETPCGTETILLVEDDVHVRTLAHRALEHFGYHVLEAQSGGDALLIGKEHGNDIHLLLTDVIMPRMSGRQLSEHLHPLHPEMKVLFMSGHTDNSIGHHGVLDPGVAFLQKPITPETLTQKVREVLDAHAS